MVDWLWLYCIKDRTDKSLLVIGIGSWAGFQFQQRGVQLSFSTQGLH